MIDLNSNISKQFIRGLENHNLSLEQINKEGWGYCGGDRSGRNNHFNLHYKHKYNLKEPPYTSKCICGHDIEENCYITNKKNILVLGNCCIKRFIDNSGKTCDKCGEQHKNFKVNRCNNCRYKYCNDCHSNIEDDYYNNEYCDNCWYKRIYIKVPYNNKDEAKELGCQWDHDKKSWYYRNKINHKKKSDILLKFKPNNIIE